MAGRQKGSVRVLYVLGSYRSGTTILTNLIGQLDGFCSVGELRTIWRELRDPVSLCGCGEPIRKCGFWSDVLKESFGSVDAAIERSAEVQRWQDRALGQTHTWTRLPPILLRKGVDLSRSDALSCYGAVLGRLYEAVATVSQAEAIVDSSKEATDGALVGLLPGIDVSYLQIVRDPRGVVNSSLQRQPHIADGFGRLRHSAYTAMSWTAYTLAGTAVRRSSDASSRMLLRYEDFSSDPVGTLEHIAAAAGISSQLPARSPTLVLAPRHTIAGNETFRAGPTEIRPDTRWRTGLDSLNRSTVTALCSPLLACYGYPFR